MPRPTKPILTAVAVAVFVIAATAKTPAAKIPCAKAKTSSKIAPEQGRNPAATIVNKALFQENPLPSVLGSGA